MKVKQTREKYFAIFIGESGGAKGAEALPKATPKRPLGRFFV